MSAHVSQLILDELATGLAKDPAARAHVDLCPECKVRLEATLAARAASQASFGYARTRARLTAQTKPTGLRAWLPYLVPALAASLMFFVALRTPRDDGSRLKGQAFVELLKDGRAVSDAKVGDRIEVKLGTGGHEQLLVVAVDEGGARQTLWQGRATGAIFTLPTQLEVTPGSVVVQLYFSEQPQGPPAASTRLSVTP